MGELSSFHLYLSSLAFIEIFDFYAYIINNLIKGKTVARYREGVNNHLQ